MTLMAPPANSPGRSALGDLKIKNRSIAALGMMSNEKALASDSKLGARMPLIIVALYREESPLTITKRLSTMVTPGILLATCDASLSWPLAI